MCRQTGCRFIGPRRISMLIPRILIQRRPKPDFRAMYQYPQIVPVYVESPANLIFIAVFQKHRTQNTPILFRELFEDAQNHVLALPRHHFAFRIHASVDQLVRVIRHRRMPGRRTKQLHHYVDRNRMNIRAQALRMFHRLVRPQEIQHPQKRFLPDIVDQLPGPQSVPQGHADGIAEVHDKMPLRFGIALAKPDQVLGIEGRLGQEF